ncbi:MAG: hflB [Bacteroidetes bacterium]|jgi:cell division protease FtsH|nr:hflB [Bacteroidota bacterium]
MALKGQDDGAEVKDPKTRNKFPSFGVYFLILLFLVYGLNFFFGENVMAKEITWQEFVKEFLAEKDVDRLEVINQEQVYVYIKPASLSKDKFSKLRDKKPGIPNYFFRIGSVEVFEKNMDEVQAEFADAEKVPVRYVKKVNWFSEALPWLIPVALLFLFWRFILSRGPASPGAGGSIFNFGKSSAVMMKKKKDSLSFKDVAGYSEAKAEVMEIVDFLKNPQNFTKLGAKIPKGVLLIGPPGTGKTLMAKAVAGEAGVAFFSLAGSEFVEMFVGVGASRVRDLFKNAKAAAPCIIFIDELDTVGRTREKAASIHVNDERESTLNQLLAEMDGFDSDTRVVVLAATNRADVLDPALTRAGRFDRHIYLELPDKNERKAIFSVHMQKLRFDNENVDAEFLASQTPGFSGADITNACNEAALIAAREKKDKIELKHFTSAIEKVVGGLEKKTMVITPREKKIISYHESGHALVSWMLPHSDPLIKISIIPRGKSLGSAWYLPEERRIISKNEFEERLCIALGGRAAEDIVFNEISSGAVDDLERVTKTAYSMVLHLGFNEKLGNVSYYDSSGRETYLNKPYSEATASMIDVEVRNLVQASYDKAKAILVQHRDKLEKLATLLNEKETLDKKQVEEILGKRNPAEA